MFSNIEEDFSFIFLARGSIKSFFAVFDKLI